VRERERKEKGGEGEKLSSAGGLLAIEKTGGGTCGGGMRKRGRMGLETRERGMAAKVAGRAAVRRRERNGIERE